jgi:cyclohexanecarboxylate-CoA ligase
MSSVSPNPDASATTHNGTLWALIEWAATAHADHVLLADDHGRSLTGGELRMQADVTAAGLAALGVGPGQRVSWQLPTTLETMVVMAALARLGAVQNPIIPVLRERDVGFIAEQVRAEHVLVPERWRGFAHGTMARSLAGPLGATVVICDHATDPATIGGALRLPTGDPATLPPPPTAGDEVRWLYYSSGTTAAPKGVRHTDGSVMASAAGFVHHLAPRADDVYPLAIPISHIGGAAMLVASLTVGMRLVLFDAFDPTTTPERMAAHGPTMLGTAVPFFLAYLAAQERHGAEPLYPRLRVAIAGGAPLPAEVNTAMRETFGIGGICNSWGLTEFPVASSGAPSDTPAQFDTTVGLPAPGVHVRAVGEDGRPLPPGDEGELQTKGPQCFQGYVDPALDAAAFDADGWFRTGDFGSVEADGRVRVSGRLKDVIVRNGENISALEVEEALFRCDDIADVAVIAVPDTRTVERVCAIVVPAPGSGERLDLQLVVRHCRSIGMTPFKIPERIELVDQIPRNAMGKALKNELRARFSQD